MAKEVRADPVKLAELARANLDAANKLGNSWRASQGMLDIPAAALGNSGGAAGLHASCQSVVDDADTATGRLVAVYEADTDNLYQTAFAYEKLDEDEARKMKPWPMRSGSLRKTGGLSPR